MMPHSICFTAGPGQSPSLWVRSGAIGPTNPAGHFLTEIDRGGVAGGGKIVAGISNSRG